MRKSELLARLSNPGASTRLAALGRAAGKPWAKDQEDACLAALMALSV